MEGRKGMYKLVCFLSDKGRQKSIDIVPSSWVRWDDEKDRLVARFMPGPFTKKKTNLLKQMVEKLDNYDESWIEYPVELNGRADTYEEGLARLRTLEERNYAYTTENESSAEQIMNEEMSTFKSTKTGSLQTLNKPLRRPLCTLTNDMDVTSDTKQSAPRGKAHNADKENMNASTSGEDSPVRSKLSERQRSKLVTSDEDSDNSSKESGEEATLKDQRSRCKNRTPQEEKRQRAVSVDDTGSKTTSCARGNSNQFRQDFDRSGSFDNVSSKILEKTNNKPVENSSGKLSPTSFAQASHRSLSKQISDVRGEVILVQQMIANLLRGKEGSDDPLHQEEEDHTIQLPVQSYEDFVEFDSKLKNDAKYRAQVKRKVIRCINPDQLSSKNMGEILRRYVVRDVAMHFTVVKKVKDKEILKETTFYKLLEESFLNVFGDQMKPKMFQQTVSSTMNNAKDWEGQRLSRMKKSLAEFDRDK